MFAQHVERAEFIFGALNDEERKVDFEKASGLVVNLADKKDRDKGIEAMQARFDKQEDGLPRIFFRADSRETLRGKEPDRFLVDAGKPTCGLDELVGYVWDEDYLEDQPIADNDHYLDSCRYVQRWVQSNMSTSKPTAPTVTKPIVPAYMGTSLGPKRW